MVDKQTSVANVANILFKLGFFKRSKISDFLANSLCVKFALGMSLVNLLQSAVVKHFHSMPDVLASLSVFLY